MDIAEFLLARIAEDEAAARERDLSRPIHFVGCYYYDHTLDVNRYCDCDEDGSASGRLLAECEAKRRIVKEHEVVLDRWCDVCSVELSATEKQSDDWPCQTVRLLALPYADHPDYEQAWSARVTA